MSRLVKSQKSLLEAISKLKGVNRRNILINADKDLIQAIADCVHNTLRGNIRLTNSQKLRLKKHRKALRKIAQNKISLEKEKTDFS